MEKGGLDLKHSCNVPLIAQHHQVLALCQNHEDLHAKVVENTKHQLFDVIAQIEPLGYGNSFSDMRLAEEKTADINKEATLQDLEKMFSSHVDTILKKYGIIVDNVTITQIDLDPAFIKRAEDVQNARMDARYACVWLYTVIAIHKH